MGNTYQWQTFYRQFAVDGTTPLSQTSQNLYTIPEGSTLRRTLFKMQMHCPYTTQPAGISYPQLEWQPEVVLAAGLWLGNQTGHAASSPPVLTDRNSADWLFWDTLPMHYSFLDDAADLLPLIWQTPEEGLDIQTVRNTVAGNENDLWLGWQFNDPSGTLNTVGTDLRAQIGGWYSIRFLISTPT